MKNIVYAYTSCTNREKADSLRRNANWCILQNNKECQAVVYKDGLKMIAFHKAGKLQHKKMIIEVDKACLVIIDKENIIVNDPMRESNKIKVRINGKDVFFDC